MTNLTVSTLEELASMYKKYYPYCLVGSVTQAASQFDSLILDVGFSELDDPWKYKSNFQLAAFVDFIRDYPTAKMVLAPLEEDWHAY